MLAVFGVILFPLLDRLSDREKFEKAKEKEKEKPKGLINATDPEAKKKSIRRNEDYGLSFMPPAEWSVPQPHPPPCLPQKECPVCPVFVSANDNLPYSVIAAGLPETKVDVTFGK